jgi:hypothetical protein
MESRDRPIAVTILSFMAFAAALAIVVLMGTFFLSIFTVNEFPSAAKQTGEFVLVCVWLSLFSVSFLALAWISFVAGQDLGRLKNRGRRLASVSMILFLFPGIACFFVRSFWWTWTGISICMLCAFSLAYLQLPSTRRRFEIPAAKQS